jgi:hypothetical protein
MIIRNINGKLINLNKYDYANDMIYYEKIMNIKKDFTKDNDIENKNARKNNKILTEKIQRNISSSLQNISNFINITLD